MNIRHLITWHEGERLHQAVRRHKLVLVLPTLFSLLGILAPFFFLFPLIKQGAFGVAIFVLSEVIGWFIFVRTWHLWDGNALLITNKRLIVLRRRGFFSRSVRDISLAELCGLEFERRGWTDALWRVGCLAIHASEEKEPAIFFYPVSRPERIEQLILSLKERLLVRRGQNALPEELIALLEEADADVLEEAFAWLKERIKKEA